MIIEIKKAKITASIMAQVQYLPVTNSCLFKALGWCVIKGSKFILLESYWDKTLRKVPMWSKLNKANNSVCCEFADSREPVMHHLESDCIDNVFKHMERIKKEALTLGQFFI